MICIHDTLDQVPYVETTTCEYHRRHPGKAYAGCCCSIRAGFRKATPEERIANLRKVRRELAERIEELTQELQRIDFLLGE